VTLFTTGAGNININRVTADTGANAPEYAINLPPLGGGSGPVYQTNIAILAGGKLAGGATAQARRVYSFMTNDNAPYLTAQGWRLFLAQVYWALGQTLPQIPPTVAPAVSSVLAVKNTAAYTSITVTNPDVNAASMSGVKFTGTNSGIFSVESPKTFPMSVAGMQNGTIIVKALPTTEGITTGTVNIGYNNGTSTLTTTFVVNTIQVDKTWRHQDLGTPTLAGTATQSGSTFTVTASGADMWGTADQGHIMYQYINGNMFAIANVAASQNLGTGTQNTWVKSGVMIRESNDAYARFVDVVVSTSNGVAMQARTTPGGGAVNVVNSVAGVGVPAYVKLTRIGNTFNGYYSNDGGNQWVLIGSINMSMNSVVSAGMAATSHDNAQLNKTTFDNVYLGEPINAVSRWSNFE
jgi:hypothetical protein